MEELAGDGEDEEVDEDEEGGEVEKGGELEPLENLFQVCLLSSQCKLPFSFAASDTARGAIRKRARSSRADGWRS